MYQGQPARTGAVGIGVGVGSTFVGKAVGTAVVGVGGTNVGGTLVTSAVGNSVATGVGKTVWIAVGTAVGPRTNCARVRPAVAVVTRA